MNIAGIEPVIVHVNQRGDWVFLLVHTDEGITGLGEASHSMNDALLLATVQVFKERLVGRSALDIEAIWHGLARFDGGRIAHTALSAIEQALWDIMGQHLGVPIHQLFGGAGRERVRLYANINRHVQDRRPEGFALAARQAAGEGFTAIKLAPFDELRAPDHIHTGPQAAWRRGVERVEAVRAAIGEAIELMVDCHGRMEASEAIQVGKALQACNLMWYEEPVPHTDIKGLARVAQNVPMPTASAESLFGMDEFSPFLTRRIVDVIMPDVKHCGGLSRARDIAQAAQLSRVLVAPHNPSGPVATVATAHVAGVIPNFLILEYAWGEVDWRADLISPREPVVDGYLEVSDTPGLGYRLNPQVLEAHRRTSPGTVDSSKVAPG